MENLTLVQIQEKIEFNRNKIELLFKTLNTSENFLGHTDHMHGKRSIHFSIRLDELSLDKMEEILPSIKQAFTEYKTLRQQEKEITEQTLIERKIQQGLLNNIIDT